MKSQKLAESYQFFIEKQQQEGLKRSTIKDYGINLINFLVYLKDKRVNAPDEITIKHIEDYLEKQDISLNKKVSTLSKYFACLTENRLVPKNLMRNFKHEREKKEQPINFLSLEEMLKMITAAQHHSKRDAVLLAIYALTGCKREEAMSLKWKQIDFQKKEILFERTNHRGQSSTQIHEMLLALLLYYTEDIDIKPDAYIFPGENSPHISPKTVSNLFLKYAKLAGIKKEFSITPSIFRNSFCTQLAISGTPLHHIMEFTGLKDMRSLNGCINQEAYRKAFPPRELSMPKMNLLS